MARGRVIDVVPGYACLQYTSTVPVLLQVPEYVHYTL